jgi:hypothetical protein
MVKCHQRQNRRLKTELRWKLPAVQRHRNQMVLLCESGMTQPAIAMQGNRPCGCHAEANSVPTNDRYCERLVRCRRNGEMPAECNIDPAGAGRAVG